MDLFCLGVGDAYWGQLLDYLPHDVYHRPAYVALEAQRLGGWPEALLVRDQERYLFLPYVLRSCAPVLPDYWSDAAPLDIVSPYGYPSCLLSPAAAESPGFIEAALELAIAFWRDRRICSAFLRLHPLLSPALNALAQTNGGRADFGLTETGRTVAIDLSLSPDMLQAQTARQHRSKARQAKQAGFQLRWGDVATELPTFVAIYRETMERVGAAEAYRFDDAYFEGLAMALGEQLHLCLVEQEGEAACASLVTETCGIVQCHLSGSRTALLPHSPSTLMTLHIRDWAKERGDRWLHLGGGLGGRSDDSLFTYKRKFSPLSYPFYTLRLVIDDNQYEQLIHERGKRTNLDPRWLRQSDFFPAYRASAPWPLPQAA